MDNQEVKTTNANRYMMLPQTRKQIFVNNFIGGISWGLGATIGLSIVLALLGILGHFVNVIPFIGNFVADIIKFVNQQNPRLR